eukprot:scaffold32872_cov84-Phaeocystis_antarctica.AAC.5
MFGHGVSSSDVHFREPRQRLSPKLLPLCFSFCALGASLGSAVLRSGLHPAATWRGCAPARPAAWPSRGRSQTYQHGAYTDHSWASSTRPEG